MVDKRWGSSDHQPKSTIGAAGYIFMFLIHNAIHISSHKFLPFLGIMTGKRDNVDYPDWLRDSLDWKGLWGYGRHC